MAKFIGEVIAKIRPYCDVDVLLHIQKQAVEELRFPFPVAQLKIVIVIVICHWNLFDIAVEMTYLGIV